MLDVARASTRCPRCHHGMEYNVASTLAWMSGPTIGRDQDASTNPEVGSRRSVGASTAANTAAGAAPSSGRQDRAPATSRDHLTASTRIASRLVNSRPRQNESRT